MNDMDGLKIGETVKTNPKLLLHRLVTAAHHCFSENDLQLIFSYELCPYPPALFESQFLLRQADKHVLASAIKENLDFYSSIQEDGETNYLIEGRILLQVLPWLQANL